jgi:hypothetical protein
MLTQALAGAVLFFDKRAESQWLHREPVPKLSSHIAERELRGIKFGPQRKALFETIEGSPIFTQCHVTSQVSDLILKLVGQVHKAGDWRQRHSWLRTNLSCNRSLSASSMTIQGPTSWCCPTASQSWP